MAFEIDIPNDAPEGKRRIVESLVAQWGRVAETRAVLRKPQMRAFANWGATKLDDILSSGAIPSFMLGGHRVATVDDFFRYVIGLAIKSPAKADKPGVRFRKTARPRTENELRGLQIANRRRAEEARVRRNHKQTEPA